MGHKRKTNDMRLRRYNNAAWAIAYKYVDEDTGEGDYRDTLYPGNLKQTVKHIITNHFSNKFGDECKEPSEMIRSLNEVIAKIQQLEDMMENIEKSSSQHFVLEMTY